MYLINESIFLSKLQLNLCYYLYVCLMPWCPNGMIFVQKIVALPITLGSNIYVCTHVFKAHFA